jgi:glycosyltransferase involved in cell wall biosynthesis
MKILAFPRDANPYQELLYGPIREQGVTVAYLEGPSGSHTLNLLCIPLLLLMHRLRGFTVLHVHWTYPFYIPGWKQAWARTLLECWAAICWLWARVLGMKIVWTAHNTRPHEPIFGNDTRAQRFLARLVSGLIVHTPAAAAQLRALGVTKLPKIISHGSYIGVYPDTLSRAAARKQLGLPATAKVLLSFGLIRPSKGIEQLLEAFQANTDQNLRLLIVGKALDQSLARKIGAAAEADARIAPTLDHIEDDQLQLYFRAADFTVLPYEQATTSGVSLLACSFASPLLVPDKAVFADIPAAARLTYAPGQLGEGVKMASAEKAMDQQAKSSAAASYAAELSWPHIAGQTLVYLRSL